jgi:hypothetical protein
MSNHSARNLRKYAQEEIAGYLVSAALGDSYQSTHCGDSDDSYDCTITKNGIPEIALEVTSDSDPIFEEMLSSLFSQPFGEAIELNKGLGRWIIHLALGAKIKCLTHDSIEEVVRSLISENIDNIDKAYVNRNHPIAHALDKLGIESMRRIDYHADIAYRFLPGANGPIDDSIDLVADHLEGFLKQEKILNKIDRLVSRAGNLHPHLAILEGSNSGLSINFRMNGLSLSDPTPNRTIALPDGLASLWFICTSSSKTLSFKEIQGWSDFSFPSSTTPWWEDTRLHYVEQMRILNEHEKFS